MYSLNAPVPPEVARLASGLARELPLADARTRHSVVVKRLSDPDSDLSVNGGRSRTDGGSRVGQSRLPQRARDALVAMDAPASEARVQRVDIFQEPTDGGRPVAYLAVESPGLRAIHEELCETFPPLSGLGGEDYEPHVTIARGEGVRDLADREVEPLTWTVERLEIWDNRHRETVDTVSLPA